jgi:hypothetical protein
VLTNYRQRQRLISVQLSFAIREPLSSCNASVTLDYSARIAGSKSVQLKNTEFRHVFLLPPDRHASANNPTFFPFSPATNRPALAWSADHLFPILHGELYDLSERFSRSAIP